MTDPEIDALAGKVADKLRTHVIPAALPKRIGDWIRELDHQRLWFHSIPLNGPNCISSVWMINPDGTIHLELKDQYGERFWEGTLISER